VSVSQADDLRRALLQAHPRLSKFNPLPRILCFDDFDEGPNGWCQLSGNYIEGSLDTMSPWMQDLRPPQLSTCTFFDVGTHGAMSGSYALKLATRPTPGHFAVAIKRLTAAARGRICFEMYFTYKAETTFGPASRVGGNGVAWDSNSHPSETEFGDFTISNDIGEPGGQRYLLALRYVNADEHGQLVQRWMSKTTVHPTGKMRLSGALAERPPDLHTLRPEDWTPVPGGDQPLCFNEVPTKVNWHYLRWQFDTRNRRNLELQVNDRVMDLRELPVPMYDHSYRALDGLMNFLVDVRTRTGVRNFLYLDSAVISVDW
jgi:hypothetical protein